MDADERVSLIRAGAVLGYLWPVSPEQGEIGSLAGLVDILEKLLSAATDAGTMEECATALHDLAGFLRQSGDDERTRMADELRTRIVQIATRATGQDVLTELRALPDDLVGAADMNGEFA